MPGFLRTIADEQLEIYGRRRLIIDSASIPDTQDIPIENPVAWIKIPHVICVFVDMKGSTHLSAAQHDSSTAGAYQLFTEAAVRIFHAMEAPYIDVRGDGVFGLFNSNQPYRALATAVSFKTYVAEMFTPTIEAKTKLNIGAHIGIDRGTVLVRKAGYKRHDGRSDRQNEVWAGKPVNMASKLAAMGESGNLFISDRYYKLIPDEHARLSCGCGSSVGEKRPLWTEVDIPESDIKFDFRMAYKLEVNWCATHGAEFFAAILGLDAAQ